MAPIESCKAFRAPFAAAPANRAAWVGNPLRDDIVALDAPAARFAGREGPLRLLVVGGSLGALALNDAVPAALSRLPEAARPQVVHQSGERRLEALQRSYASAGIAAECVAFIDDMARRYAWADIVVCRGGALTVAELAAVGLGRDRRTAAGRDRRRAERERQIPAQCGCCDRDHPGGTHRRQLIRSPVCWVRSPARRR